MRVLFVENDARFARIAAQQFLANHEIIVAPSLQSARETLANSHFDIVLLDYDLDDGKGSELMTAVHDLGPRPFIVATSSHEIGNATLLAAGADVACSKMKFRELPRILDEYKMSLDLPDK
jgi:DNA-binding response OmpR family regulator